MNSVADKAADGIAQLRGLLPTFPAAVRATIERLLGRAHKKVKKVAEEAKAEVKAEAGGDAPPPEEAIPAEAPTEAAPTEAPPSE